ncbi:4503_t:CDS:2, partial [Racocetra fulgida]
MQEYAMIMKYTIHGDLKKFLTNNKQKFLTNNNLSWIKRIEILQNIAKSLNELHNLNIVHRDFHCGNILVDDNTRIFISDFGLSMFINELEPSGVLPYIAPEVLTGKPYTKKSDIYSLGIIMWELTSLDRPFSDRTHDGFLAIEIIHNLRPKIVEGTPEIYQDIMKQCWDDDPLKRPDLSQLIKDYENMIKDMEEQSSIGNMEPLLPPVIQISINNLVISFSRTVSPSNTPISLSRSSSEYKTDIPKIDEGSDEDLENIDPSFNKMRDLLSSLIHEATEAVEAPVKGREKKKRAPSTTSQQSFDFGDINDMLDELEEDDEYEYEDSDDEEEEEQNESLDEENEEPRGRGCKREKSHKRQKSVHEERFEQGMLEFNRSIADFSTLVDAITTEDNMQEYDPCIQYVDPTDQLIRYPDTLIRYPNTLIRYPDTLIQNPSENLVEYFAQLYRLLIRTLILPFLLIRTLIIPFVLIIYYFIIEFFKTSNSSRSMTNITVILSYLNIAIETSISEFVETTYARPTRYRYGSDDEIFSPKNTYLNSELIEHVHDEH